MRSAAAGGAALVAATLLRAAIRRSRRHTTTPTARARDDAVRGIHRGASVLALSVLADSALEHYRGSFENRAMYVAPSAAATTLTTAVRASAAPRRTSDARSAIYAGALAIGLVGTGFHVYNVFKGPGGLLRSQTHWTTVLYGAPLGAPLALSLAGVLGLAADRAIDGESVLGLPPGRAVAAVSSVGLLGTAAEAGILHFRGAFQNPFMYVPVVLPPLAAAVLAATVVRPVRLLRRTARMLLRATYAIGLAGVGFHAYGVQRNMGGYRNWSQMIFQGPPVPAPPAFTGLALSGLSALDLMEEVRA